MLSEREKRDEREAASVTMPLEKSAEKSRLLRIELYSYLRKTSIITSSGGEDTLEEKTKSHVSLASRHLITNRHDAT